MYITYNRGIGYYYESNNIFITGAYNTKEEAEYEKKLHGYSGIREIVPEAVTSDLDGMLPYKVTFTKEGKVIIKNITLDKWRALSNYWDFNPAYNNGLDIYVLAHGDADAQEKAQYVWISIKDTLTYPKVLSSSYSNLVLDAGVLYAGTSYISSDFMANAETWTDPHGSIVAPRRLGSTRGTTNISGLRS